MKKLENSVLTSKKYSVSQYEIDSFAAVSGGMGTIHTDPDYALNTIFKKTLVHGLYLLALIEKEVSMLFEGETAVSELNVIYLKPVLAKQEFQIKFIKKLEEQWEIILESDDQVMVKGTVSLK